MSGVTQAQALAVLRDLVEQQERLDPEVLAWVADVAARWATVGPWQQQGASWCRMALDEAVATVWEDATGWRWEAHFLASAGGRTHQGASYTTRQEAMRAADERLRRRGYWCDEATP